MYRQGIVNAERVLASRSSTFNEDWTRGERAYYGQGWDLSNQSTFRLPNTQNTKVRRYQSRGNKVERIS